MTIRRLAAILAADVVGFSKLIGEDEAGTLAVLREIRKGIVNPILAEHGGRVFKLMGDGMLVEFPSAVQALRAAMGIQDRMRERNTEALSGQSIQVRIGVHQGDVVVEGTDLLGDGVNIAARLEGLAEPGGICVSGRVHEDATGKIMLEAQDIGEQSLKNIARPVRAYRISLGSTRSGTTQGEPEPTPLPLPDRPSLAVLPFQNMSGEPEQEYFADGIVEDIITALSRIRWLFVIARNSSFTYKGQAIDVKRVAHEFGVRYVLEGSVRKGGGRVRITAQLIDAENGAHLWADRYDRDLTDIFAVQDEITATVAAVIEPALAEAEQKRAWRKPPARLDAWETYQRGLWHFYKYRADEHRMAKTFFRRAVELDPNFAPGHYGIALAQHLDFWLFPASLSWSEVAGSGLEEARIAVSLDEKDSMAHVVLSFMHEIAGEWEPSIAEARSAVGLNPNSAWSMLAMGHALGHGGHHKDGIDYLSRAIRASPHDPLNWLCTFWTGQFSYYSRDYAGALAAMGEVAQVRPDLTWTWKAAALAQISRTAEASEALDKAIAVRAWWLERLARQRPPWMRPDDYAHLLEGLRKSGWRG